MGLVDTERNRAAVHEAGHALVAASRRLDVAVIELHGNDGAGGMLLRGTPSALDRIWILYGGPFAEKVVFGRWLPIVMPPEEDELLLAHSLCRQMGISNTIGIMDRVEAYLREQRIQLELAATRLLDANMLQGAELDNLLRQDVLS